ncbi:hypothetical protein DS682_22760 [Salmonella enterica subsp. diarizonae]|nr:hypothetical protein [Salmonella enterica subsp. diarizonae]HDC2479331.1 hypothetical protein [Salmonella enterica]
MNYNELTKLANKQIDYFIKEANKCDSPNSFDEARMNCGYAFGTYQLWASASREMALKSKSDGVAMMNKINQQCEIFEDMMDKKKIPAFKHLYKND